MKEFFVLVAVFVVCSVVDFVVVKVSNFYAQKLTERILEHELYDDLVTAIYKYIKFSIRTMIFLLLFIVLLA